MTNADQNNAPLILVVDDDRFMRLQLCRVMEQVGYRVAEASDGEEALAVYLRDRPDVVLLDALMPVCDGFSCCTQLQALPGGDRTPVLMTTALEDQDSVDRAFAVGAADYITKPIHWAVLRQRVRRLLQESRAAAELRAQTEQTRLSEARLRLALEAAHTGIWDWNIQTGSVKWSDNVEQLLGLASGTDPLETDRTYKAFLKCVHSEDRKCVTQSVRRAIAERRQDQKSEFRILWADGSVRWLIARGRVFYAEGGEATRMVGTLLDITERKKVEAELQRQNWRSRLFAEVTLKIRQSLQIEEILHTTVTEVQRIFQTDRVLIFQFWANGIGKVVTEAVNPNWSEMLGETIADNYFASEYLQRYSQGRVYTLTDAETAQIPPCLVEFLKQFEVKAKLAVPIFLKKKLWGLLIAHQCSYPRQWTGFEMELLQQLANQIGIALAQAQMLEQATRYSQELARSNAELEKFANVASHDLQEPLRKIQTFGERLKTKYRETLTEQGRDYLERMQNAAERMQTLIDDLLTLSRITTKAQPFVPVALAQVVQDVISDLEVRIDETQGHLEVGLLPTVEAEPLQMRQLMQNLIGNALKFHKKGEPPQVKIYSQLLNAQQQSTENAAVPKFWQIRVEDNGIGFDEACLERIFNVFQRLHGRSEYEGTGVGLAICRKIVERHGGSITAESTLGQGATFIVTLPIKQGREASEPGSVE